MGTLLNKDLNALYRKYNRKSYLDSDPILLVHEYENAADQEIAGLIAATLAYGRVDQILKSARTVLNRMGSPSHYAKIKRHSVIQSTFKDFKHRFTTGDEMAGLIFSAGEIIRRYGSLGTFFRQAISEQDDTLLPALTTFAHALRKRGYGNSLVSDPAKGSACKRLNLYLRWMVRQDAVDLGAWSGISTSKLIVPLDTHMHRIATSQGWTKRKSADMKTALEITRRLSAASPSDPIKYDFALTRSGILATRSRSKSKSNAKMEK